MEKRVFTEEELKKMEKSVIEGMRVSFALEGLAYTEEEWLKMENASSLMESVIGEEFDNMMVDFENKDDNE